MKFDSITLINIYGHKRTHIDFNAAACVVIGDNGAGKSTLFVDGPLFALYGRSAVRGATLANVVRQGAEEGTARLIFTLDGKQYKAQRTYSLRTKAGSSFASLEVKHDGEWIVLEDGNVSEVDAAIEKLIGADYQAFTLGSVMRQGASSDFTSLTPAGRIKALSQIVAVSHLRDAFEAAGSEQHSLKGEANLLREKINVANELREKLAEAKQALAQASDNLEESQESQTQIEFQIADLRKQIAESRKRIAELDEKIAADATRLEEINNLRKRQLEIAERISETSTQHNAQQVEAHHLLSILGFQQEPGTIPIEKEILERVASRLPELETQKLYATEDLAFFEAFDISEIEEKSEASSDSISTYKRVVDNLAGKIEYLATSIEKYSKEVREKPYVEDAQEQRAGRWFMVPDQDKIEAQLSVALQALEGIKAASIAVNKAKMRRESLVDAVEARQRSMKRQREILARQADTSGRPEECQMHHCGFLASAQEAQAEIARLACDTEVEELQAQIEGAEKDIREALASVGAEKISELESLEINQAKRYEDLASALKASKEIQTLIGDYASAVSEKSNAWNNIEMRQEADADCIKEYCDRFAVSADNFEDLIEAIQESENNLRDLLPGIDAKIEASLKLTECFKQRWHFAELVWNLREEQQQIEAKLSSLEKESEAKRIAGERSAAQADISESRSDLEQVERQLASCRSNLLTMIETKAKLQARVQTLNESLEGIEDAESRLAAVKSRIQLLTYARDFLNIAPSMVIGRAIPMIESTANNILRDISPGTTLRIDRQRQTKSGNVRDEITIVVIEDGAERDLDTFSGGERFRIDVALRLALARAAAGRSTGKSLETLIVDEGWGSLDAAGIASLKDAFSKLSSRFARIIVITHIPDVIDLFGEVIEVSSMAQGAGTTLFFQ
jgi:exonuclease SbcC